MIVACLQLTQTGDGVIHIRALAGRLPQESQQRVAETNGGIHMSVAALLIRADENQIFLLAPRRFELQQQIRSMPMRVGDQLVAHATL